MKTNNAILLILRWFCSLVQSANRVWAQDLIVYAHSTYTSLYVERATYLPNVLQICKNCAMNKFRLTHQNLQLATYFKVSQCKVKYRANSACHAQSFIHLVGTLYFVSIFRVKYWITGIRW